MKIARLCLLAALLPTVIASMALPATASTPQKDSRLSRILQTGTLRVCQITNFYAVSYRNPKTDQVEGIDADLGRELAKELGVKFALIESSFAAFIADLQSDKCDIGMFGIASTLKRAQVVEFSKPYLQTGIYGVVRKGGKVQSWEDMDKPGVRVGVSLGSYTDTFMRSYLKQATVIGVAPPATIAGELAANRADVVIGNYATALRTKKEFDWAEAIAPERPLLVTPFAYALPQGDQVWLNFVNLFIDTVKLDGRLKELSDKYELGPMSTP